MSQTAPPADLLRQLPGAAARILHAEPLPPRPPRYADGDPGLPAPLRAALAARGIERLYTHQAAALEAARAGAHLGIVTATASGKTLCYQLPVLERLLADPADRALLLFPTKALAQDQLRSLEGLLAALADERQTTNDESSAKEQDGHAAHRPSSSVLRPSSLTAATLDGDTPSRARERVRAAAQIVLSNPDMLHRTVLPDHRRWAGWLARLRFVVLDEAHIYRGVFGTHVALIMRRLQRLCAYYGGAPQFICCSATSANPEEHLAALVGAPVTVLADDGAPQGRRTFVFWNPPLIEDGRRRAADDSTPGYDEELSGRHGRRSPSAVRPSSNDGGARRSTNVEAAQVFAALVRAGVKTLAFARSRRSAELMLRYAREALETAGEQPSPTLVRPSPVALRPSAVAAYRAGYRADDRRALEQAFLRGEIRGLVSTNALELGVDIGGVDAVVIAGYPGTVASTWQQAGRAGRSQGSSLAVLVAQSDPLDQFYMRHPAQFFARPHEQARVALHNPYILSDQLCCAAAELPLSDADIAWFGKTMPALRDWLLRHGRLLPTEDGECVAVGRPAIHVNIRSADGASVALRDADSGHVVEHVPMTRAPFELHPGAVYLHQGDTLLVERLNGSEAIARRATLDYYTQTRDTTEVAIERVISQRESGPATVCHGIVTVTRQVTGYVRKQHRSEAVLSEHDLLLPPQSFRTQAVWWTVPEALAAALLRAGADLPGALHAMEHAGIGLLPLFAQCDRWDIGGLSTALHEGTGLATIFVYDGVPGGVGIAEVGFQQAEAWWRATADLLRDCPCADGCPSCVQSPKCGSGNQPLDKDGARLLAEALLGAPPLANGRASLAKPQHRTADQLTALLADLAGRLERARAEVGVRRGALLAALRYRLASERAGPLRDDPAALEALDVIEAAAGELDGRRAR
jgi:DEAD/DEAH box helicase domain-containing protein